MRKILLFFTFCALILSSCDNDVQDELTNNPQDQIKSQAIVLKERDPNSPLILSKRRTKNLKNRIKSGNEPFKNYLGKSFKAAELPLTDYKNFGWSVIDIDNYLKANPNSYYNAQIGTTESNSFAYTGFNKYVEKSEVNKKVKGGFKLNLGIFSIGAKRSMERTFSKTTVNESNRVFGELHYQYMDSRYWLKNTSNDIKKMKSYVSQSFTDDLYNITPGELFDTYGGFVLCDFIVGGKATALYSGVYNGNESSETRGKKMQTDISASYGKKASGDFGIGKGYSNGKESSNKFTDLRASVKTLGGIGAIINFTNPEKVNSINVNLTGWLASLNNKSTHRIIDISDNGLLPITEFIREDNLKHHLARFMKAANENSIDFSEPVIKYIHIKKLDWEVLFLNTRHGDGIKLYGGQKTSATYTQALIDKYSSLCKVRYVDWSVPVNEVLMNIDPFDDNDSGVQHPFFENLYDEAVMFAYGSGLLIDKMIDSDMEKCTHNNINYLISKKKGVKFAYAIHDDYILDTYGIREWVRNMSATQISQRELDTYTIIAL